MEWRIVQIGDSEPVAFAVEELRRCLPRIDPAVTVTLVKGEDRGDCGCRGLQVGLMPSMRDRLPPVEDPVLDDAIRIDVRDGTGVVTGTNERSVLIAAYRLLREMGVRWIRPGGDGEIIHSKSLSGIEVQVCEKPSYRHRGVCIEGACSLEHVRRMIDWLPKIGMNSYFIQFMVPYTFFDRWSAPRGERLDVETVAGMGVTLGLEIRKRGMISHAVGHGWTCEPFGLRGIGWEPYTGELPVEIEPYLALVDGERRLSGGIALNTNLCYSNPAVRQRMAEAVVEYCRGHGNVDYVHFWLADGWNNHCECENCRDTLPSDRYVELLNEIDARLSRENLGTRLVFLLYVDLLWAPERERLHNPGRFCMMFAPITRTYSVSLPEGFDASGPPVRPYVRNRLDMPRDVRENLSYLSLWQDRFTGDSFDFDYHMFHDHVRDPGGYRMAQVLFEDVKNLRGLGLNGLMSCQVQRAFFPTGLANAAMAEALWNRERDFGEVSAAYHRDVFGADAEPMMRYFQTLSREFDPPWLRGERETESEDTAVRLDSIPAYIGTMLPLIDDRLAAARDACGERTWRTVRRHAELCILLALVLSCRARGDREGVRVRWARVCEFFGRVGSEVEDVFDEYMFRKIMERTIGIRSDD